MSEIILHTCVYISDINRSMAFAGRENEDEEERSERRSLFSYDVARALFMLISSPRIITKWRILEKGSDHSLSGEERTLTSDVIRAAGREIRENILRPHFFSYGSKIHSLEHYYHRIFLIRGYIQNRGIAYTLQQIADKGLYDTVVAFSTDGSFAGSLSFYGQKYKLNVTVVMASSVHPSQIELCKIYGANVICKNTNNPVDLHIAALNIARTEGLVYIDRYDHPDIVIGGATLALDILENIYRLRSLSLIEQEDSEEEDTANSRMMQNQPLLEFVVLLPTASNSSGLSVALAIALKEHDPSLKIFEVRPIDWDLGNSSVRRLTKTTREVAGVIPSKYTWFSYFDLKKVFDGILRVENALVRTQYRLLNRHGIGDIDAAICLAAIESQQYNQMLRGKFIATPLYGDMEWSSDFVNDITSDSLSWDPNVPGPSNQ